MAVRRAFAFAAALWTLALTTNALAQDVYVQNTSDTVDNSQLADALPAFQAAVTEDFAPAWNIQANLVLLPYGMDPPEGVWSILVSGDWSPMYDGYHDVLGGLPVGFVSDTEGWQVTFTHELFEMLADPWTDRTVRVQRRLYPFYYLETGDPVEDNQFAYTRPSASGAPVLISDFVLPSWFRAGSAGPWDFRGHTTKPLQILPGGYQIAWSKKTSRWVQLCFKNLMCA